MSMRRQEKDEDKFESECSYCGAGVHENAMRCPRCKKWFSSGKKAIVLSVVAIVVMASMGAFFYNYLAPGHEGYDGGDEIPDGGGSSTSGNTSTGKSYMVIGTSLGQIKIELDTTNAPVTASHMASLVNSGYFEDAGKFYRAEPGFVIQGGTQSGSSETVAWEDTGLLNKKYTISMARSGTPSDIASSGTGSSEFFINLADNTNLDSQYAYVVFGKVVSGYNIVDQIAGMPTTSSGGINMLNSPVAFTSVAITNS
ncbi:MAG: peptidylprolyl isomerase [Methanobacteriota archaeon]